MNRTNRIAACALFSLGLLSAGCENSPFAKDDAKANHKHDGALAKADAPNRDRSGTGKEALPELAVAVIHGAGDNKEKIHGTLTFTQVSDGVRVQGDVEGLSPGKHGIHLHQSNDLSDPALKSAGPHFNPDGHKHGGPETEMRHAGDLGNLTAEDKGKAHIDGVFKGITLRGEKNGIVGKSVIIHATEDDLKTDPSGNSGDRIAGGAVESKPSGATTKPAGA